MVFHLILLMIFFVATNGVIVIIECDQSSCSKKCHDAYGTKLIRAYCQHTFFGNFCICEHNPIIHEGSRKSLHML